MTLASFWAGASSEVKITTRLRGSTWSGRGGRGFGRISGGIPAWELSFSSASGVEAALVLDYAGVVGGQFFAGGANTITFDDLHTFARASLATQRDTAGLVKFVPHNILVQSNAFATTWLKTNAAAPTQVTQGPDGVSNSGWKFVDSGLGGTGAVNLRQDVTVAISSTYTFSIYAKKDKLNFIGISIKDFTTPANGTSSFDLLNGVVTTEATGHTAVISDAGNGWWLCSVEFFTDATDTTGQVKPFVAQADGDFVLDLDDSSSIFISSASFYQSPMAAANDTFAGTYVPTTAAAVYQHRLDHDKAGNRTGLMLEEARTNITLQSADFGTTWVETGTSVVSTNTTVAPDGTTTADTLTDNDGGGYESIKQVIVVPDDSNTYTLSIFIKKDADETRFPEVQFQFSPGSATLTIAQLNTKTGATTIRSGPGSASTEDWGDYWRLLIVHANNGGGNTNLDFIIFPAVTTVFGNAEDSATGSIICWGAQIEVGPFPSSPIPTTTVAVTRARETAKMLVSSFGYDTATGSVIANWIHPLNEGNPGLWMFNGDDPPTASRGITLQSEEIRLVTRDASNANATSTTTSTAGIEYKAAGSWNSNKHAFLSVNGGAVVSDIVDTISPTITTLYIGFQNTSTGSFEDQNGPVKSIVYFAPKLSDADLIAGSTL